jgi:hypothetical protein
MRHGSSPTHVAGNPLPGAVAFLQPFPYVEQVTVGTCPAVVGAPVPSRGASVCTVVSADCSIAWRDRLPDSAPVVHGPAAQNDAPKGGQTEHRTGDMCSATRTLELEARLVTDHGPRRRYLNRVAGVFSTRSVSHAAGLIVSTPATFDSFAISVRLDYCTPNERDRNREPRRGSASYRR